MKFILALSAALPALALAQTSTPAPVPITEITSTNDVTTQPLFLNMPPPTQPMPVSTNGVSAARAPGRRPWGNGNVHRLNKSRGRFNHTSKPEGMMRSRGFGAPGAFGKGGRGGRGGGMMKGGFAKCDENAKTCVLPIRPVTIGKEFRIRWTVGKINTDTTTKYAFDLVRSESFDPKAQSTPLGTLATGVNIINADPNAALNRRGQAMNAFNVTIPSTMNLSASCDYFVVMRPETSSDTSSWSVSAPLLVKTEGMEMRDLIKTASCQALRTKLQSEGAIGGKGRRMGGMSGMGDRRRGGRKFGGGGKKGGDFLNVMPYMNGTQTVDSDPAIQSILASLFTETAPVNTVVTSAPTTTSAVVSTSTAVATPSATPASAAPMTGMLSSGSQMTSAKTSGSMSSNQISAVLGFASAAIAFFAL